MRRRRSCAASAAIANVFHFGTANIRIQGRRRPWPATVETRRSSFHSPSAQHTCRQSLDTRSILLLESRICPVGVHINRRTARCVRVTNQLRANVAPAALKELGPTPSAHSLSRIPRFARPDAEPHTMTNSFLPGFFMIGVSGLDRSSNSASLRRIYVASSAFRHNLTRLIFFHWPRNSIARGTTVKLSSSFLARKLRDSRIRSHNQRPAAPAQIQLRQSCCASNCRTGKFHTLRNNPPRPASSAANTRRRDRRRRQLSSNDRRNRFLQNLRALIAARPLAGR